MSPRGLPPEMNLRPFQRERGHPLLDTHCSVLNDARDGDFRLEIQHSQSCEESQGARDSEYGMRGNQQFREVVEQP